MSRILTDGQRSRVFVYDLATGEQSLIHESSDVLYEAPNWTIDGAELVINGDGALYRLPADGSSAPRRIDNGNLAELNNDHVLDPNGKHVFVSAMDRHIYRAPLAGGEATRITDDDGGRFHFLHGVSPDGSTLAYIGVEIDPDGTWNAPNVFTIPAEGGENTQLTNDRFPDDGSEYSPDGEWIYFNSERADTGAGHAQLYRMRPDGSGIEQLTSDERVNWFPHVSPDGSKMVFISFPPGTIGHPADKDVILRLANVDGSEQRDLVHLFGGQGTINVPSWSPDSTKFAFVDYPIA
jgi:Tol biopolymer transport system component